MSHLLGSHPKFAHAGESYIEYRSEADFRRLAEETAFRLRKIVLRADYIVDQINHGVCVTPEILRSRMIYKCVILMRSPEATLKSRMVTAAAPGMPGMSETEALQYYVSRLHELAAYGNILQNKAIVVEYEQLVDAPDLTLGALSNFFDVTPPFDRKYKRHRLTGENGDPSRNIHAGEIIRTASHNVILSEASLQKASDVYESTKRQLKSSGVILPNFVQG
jgi:hypothetical protein